MRAGDLVVDVVEVMDSTGWPAKPGTVLEVAEAAGMVRVAWKDAATWLPKGRLEKVAPGTWERWCEAAESWMRRNAVRGGA